MFLCTICRDHLFFLHVFRNFRQNGEGAVQEIGFEQFLVVMSHFRPPSLHMTEEQRESVRREKLRCVCLEANHMIACSTLLGIVC